MTEPFPFTSVVGADDAKLALVLAALDPAIGGVLLRGEKGSAKTTLARGLAQLLPGGAPFVELPIGSTEDRVIGSIDIAAALAGGEVRLRPGLLAAADSGVLYVDEVNLLPDHLVDALLDVAASGVNRIERDGVATAHPARFVLVGSMNPEEGELRPQFLDRFGLSVDVTAPTDLDARAEAVARRLEFDRAGPGSAGEVEELAVRLAASLAAAAPVVSSEMIRSVGALCVAVGAQGLRADLVICRAAAALARWEGRRSVEEHDVRRVAPMALAHRARRDPFEEHGVPQDRLDKALDNAFGNGESEEVVAPDAPPESVPRLPAGRGIDAPAGKRSTTFGSRGRHVRDRPLSEPPGPIAVPATIREAAVSGAPSLQPTDLREAVREQRAGNLVVLAVDASGSMGVERRMEATKGAVVGLLTDAYQRRDRVALITFRDDDAAVVLKPTGSVEVAQARLAALPTGGRTPLAAGIDTALRVASGPMPNGQEPVIVLVTDGRATSAPAGTDPVAAARRAAEMVRRRGITSVVIDVEDGASRLGLAAELAGVMGARHLPLQDVTADRLRVAVRSVLGSPA